MVKVRHALLWRPGFSSQAQNHSSVSSHSVAVAHIEELEGLTTRIYNYVLGLWGRKKRGRLVTDVSSGWIFPCKKTKQKQNLRLHGPYCLHRLYSSGMENSSINHYISRSIYLPASPTQLTNGNFTAYLSVLKASWPLKQIKIKRLPLVRLTTRYLIFLPVAK